MKASSQSQYLFELQSSVRRIFKFSSFDWTHFERTALLLRERYDSWYLLVKQVLCNTLKLIRCRSGSHCVSSAAVQLVLLPDGDFVFFFGGVHTETLPVTLFSSEKRSVSHKMAFYIHFIALFWSNLR